VHRLLLEQQEHGGTDIPALRAHAAATVMARTAGPVAERTATSGLTIAVAGMLVEVSVVIHENLLKLCLRQQ
jgi:hypothetical protein